MLADRYMTKGQQEVAFVLVLQPSLRVNNNWHQLTAAIGLRRDKRPCRHPARDWDSSFTFLFHPT